MSYVVVCKEDNIYIVRVYKEFIQNFDIYDTDNILELFKSILMKLKSKYKINGLCYIDVYVNEKYGMIIEINNVYKYDDEMDIKISFHVDSIFMNEINFDVNDIDCYEEIYYYDDKYYANYDIVHDSNIIYKNSLDIINNGIRIK